MFHKKEVQQVKFNASIVRIQILKKVKSIKNKVLIKIIAIKHKNLAKQRKKRQQTSWLKLQSRFKMNFGKFCSMQKIKKKEWME